MWTSNAEIMWYSNFPPLSQWHLTINRAYNFIFVCRKLMKPLAQSCFHDYSMTIDGRAVSLFPSSLFLSTTCWCLNSLLIQTIIRSLNGYSLTWYLRLGPRVLHLNIKQCKYLVPHFFHLKYYMCFSNRLFLAEGRGGEETAFLFLNWCVYIIHFVDSL